MIGLRSSVAVVLLTLLSACAGTESPQAELEPVVDVPILRIQLDGENPAASVGELQRPEGPLRFSVGQGRYGIACAGTRFQEGVTPLGRFSINAILSEERFEMDP